MENVCIIHRNNCVLLNSRLGFTEGWPKTYGGHLILPLLRAPTRPIDIDRMIDTTCLVKKSCVSMAHMLIFLEARSTEDAVNQLSIIRNAEITFR